MITIKEEDTKLFEQDGFSQEDVGNTVNHYRQMGLSDDAIQKKINIRIGMLRHPENVTPYMQIANNPNLSQEEKVAQLNALNNQENEYNTKEKLYARKRVNEINQFKQAHPFLAGMNSMFNPIADANDNYLQELAEKGHATFGGTFKRGAMGGLTSLGNIGAFMSGGAALGANAAKLSNASKLARTMGLGGVSFASPVASSSVNKVINKELTPQEAVYETGKAFGTGAILAPIGLASHTGISNAVKNAMVNNAKGKIAQEAVKKGHLLEEEILNNLANKMVEAQSKQALTGAAMATPGALTSGALDTATFAGIEYGLDKLQGRNEGGYLDYLKATSPLMAFSALPIGMKALSPAVRKAGYKLEEGINKSDYLSRRWAETKNALNLGESEFENIRKYQNSDRLLQKVSGNPARQLDREANQDIQEARQITNKKEQENIIKSWKYGDLRSQKEKKFDELKKELEQRPVVENNIVPLEGKVEKTNVVEKTMPKINENTSAGINTPTEVKTLENEPFLHSKNQFSKYEQLKKELNEKVPNKDLKKMLDNDELTQEEIEGLLNRVNEIQNEQKANTNKISSDRDKRNNGTDIIQENNQTQKNSFKGNPRSYEEDLSNFKITKLESGMAEGADTLQKKTTRDKVKVDEAEKQKYENDFYEESPYIREVKNEDVYKEEPLSRPEYVTDDPDFIKWYDKYKQTKSDVKKNNLLKAKLTSFKKNEERSEFYKNFTEQEDRDINIRNFRLREANKDIPINERNEVSYQDFNENSGIKGYSRVKTRSDLPPETKRLVNIVKDNDIDLSPKHEIEISQNDREKAERLLKTVLPSKMTSKWNNEEVLNKLFAANSYSKTGNGANTLYKSLLKKITRIKANLPVKVEMMNKLNEAADKYTLKTGNKINKTKGYSIQKQRAYHVLDMIEAAYKDVNIDKARELIDLNKDVLKYTKGFRDREDVIPKVYNAISERALNDVNKLLDEGKIEEAKKLWERYKPVIKNANTDYSIKQMPNKGDTWTKGSAENPAKEWERIEREIEGKIHQAKIKAVSDFLNKGIVSKELENIEVKANDLKDTCPDLKPFIDKTPDVKLKFDKLALGTFGTYMPYENTVYINCKSLDKTSIHHEYQHAIDYNEIMKQPNNKDLQLLRKHSAVVNEERRWYETQYKEVIDEVFKLSSTKKYSSKEDIISAFDNDIERQIVTTYLNDYYEAYFDDIMEVRARIAQQTGIPVKETLEEIIDEYKKTKPAIWEDYKEAEKRYGHFKNGSFRPFSFRQFTRGTDNRLDKMGERTKVNHEQTLHERINKFKQENPEKWKRYEQIAEEHEEKGSIGGLRDFGNIGQNVYENRLNYLEARARKAQLKGEPLEQSLKQEIADGKINGTLPKEWNEFISRNNANNTQRINRISQGMEHDYFNNVGHEFLNSEDRFHVIRDSKATEKDLIDLGIITKEQAKNRLKQQHKAGRGVYYQQFTEHSIDGIDINRDFQAERNNKEGWFGKKSNEGVRDKASVQQIVKNTKLRRIQAENIKNSLDYIEKNFAEKIGSNGVKDGYVAVNKHLLANAMWGKTTKEWYKTVAKGEEAIKKAFKNEKQAKGWIELHNRTKTQDFQIPEELFNTLFDGRGENLTEYWNRYESAYKGKTAKLTGTVLDIANNFFKRRVLGTVSFALNNRMNQLMIGAKSDNAVDYLKSLVNATKIKDIDLPSEILENSIAEAVEQATKRKTFTGNNNLDNLLNLFNGQTINMKTIKGWKQLPASVGNVVIGFPNKLYNVIADNLLKLNTKFETFERKQVYSQKLDKAKKEILEQTGQKMVSMQETIKYVHEHPEMKETVIRSIEDTLGDYNNFNKFERDFLKRVIPFYSWFRTITRHTIHLAKENPARCAMIFAELDKMMNEDDDLKEYQKGAIRTNLTDKRSGKKLLVNKVKQIPYNTFKELGEPDGKTSMISPSLRVPLEAIRGKKFFRDSEITNDRYVREKNFDNKTREKHPYKYYDTKTGDYIYDLPVTTRLGYVGKEVLRDTQPLIYNNTLNIEGIAGGLNHLLKTGEFLENDKSYDASLGGFHHGDVAGSKLTKRNGYKYISRYANDTSEQTKILNRLGLTLQPQQELSKSEKEKLKERTKKYKEKHKKG